MKKIIALILIAGPVWAAQQCVTLDGSAYSADQLSLVPAIANELGFAQNPSNTAPSCSNVGKNITICFTNPTFTVATVITTTTLLNQYQTDKVARDSAAAQALAWQVELSTTEAASNGIFASWGTLNTAQKDAVLKFLARIQELKNLLGLQ